MIDRQIDPSRAPEPGETYYDAFFQMQLRRVRPIRLPCLRLVAAILSFPMPRNRRGVLCSGCVHDSHFFLTSTTASAARGTPPMQWIGLLAGNRN